MKNVNISFSFDFFSFYKFCFSLLLKITILPFIEVKLDNFSVYSRFTDDTSDVILRFKSILLRNLVKSWYFNISILTGMNYIANEWLFKNFPIDSKFLKNFLKIGNFVFAHSIFLLIFSYLFNGLVRITLLYFL